jgi:hypothetical protein
MKISRHLLVGVFLVSMGALATTLSIHIGFRLTLVVATLVYAPAGILFARATDTVNEPAKPAESELSDLQPA